MESQSSSNIKIYFEELEDPRTSINRKYPLISIIALSICAVISGANDWVGVELYGKSKIEWLEKFLDLPNGIPSHDTLGRVFRALDPEQFQSCFVKWVGGIAELEEHEIIAIDGKQLRRSHNKGIGQGAIHMVSAWASANGVVLGQEKVDEKSNEITAIPRLLEVLALEGCIVTIDAMGCQTEIAEKIVEGKGDYVLALKGNQGNLHEDVKLLFDDLEESNFTAYDYDYCKTVDKGHGRIEVRHAWTISGSDIIPFLRGAQQWKKLNSVIKVQSERYIGGFLVSKEVRYFISSLPSDAKLALRAVRTHWAVENSLHWVLDIAFREDESRVRSDHAPHNFAILRHIARNVLSRRSPSEPGTYNQRLRAGWDNSFLEYILSVNFT